MNEPNITSPELARCLSILDAAAKPIVAAALAVKLSLPGSRETQRRHVRALVEHLRKNGAHIIATQSQGYFLTADPQLWRDYLEGRQIGAKRILGETNRRKRMLTEGQGVLFDMRRRCGVAVCGAKSG